MNDGQQELAPLAALAAVASDVELAPGVVHLAETVRREVDGPVLAVLAYGSCLRGVALDESLVDLYVLVESYAQTHANPVSRLANRLVPPNVYYAETRFGDMLLRTKYAVVTLDQFEHRVSGRVRNPYFWARFCQPAAVAYAASQAVRDRLSSAFATSVTTFLGFARSIGEARTSEEVWISGFAATYGTELRSEDRSRARHIYEANSGWYDEAFALAPETPGPRLGRGQLRLVSWQGKALSVLRLVKASFTFKGGADYLAWKIERHSGVRVELTPWQRRHPVLAAFILFPRLYARGAFR